MREAIRLANENVSAGLGGPFGAVIVKDGQIIATGVNKVTSSNDPTAHAEVVAIREACHKLQSFQLAGCEVYTSCEPCPMCLGALYWARPDVIYFGAGRQDAAEINFDDQFIYDELNLELSSRSLPAVQLLREEALAPFALWSKSTMKIPY